MIKRKTKQYNNIEMHNKYSSNKRVSKLIKKMREVKNFIIIDGDFSITVSINWKLGDIQKI